MSDIPPGEERAAFDKFLQQKRPLTMSDLDLDAMADGIIAHREGKGFHENPLGMQPSIRRFSWSWGWNERALRQR